MLDRDKNDASALLDFLRAAAAQMVCVGHGFVFFHVAEQLRPPYFPFIQNIGVLLFFVMSGFLITATLFKNLEKPGYTFEIYFIDRFARIYSALLPALALAALIDWMTCRAVSLPPNFYQYDTINALIANVFMLEGYRGAFPKALQWAAFGSAAPLWTLAIEWHIYMLVGAVFFLAKRCGSPLLLIPVALFYGQTPLHLLFGAFQTDGVGTGLFSLWLGGSASYLLFRRCVPPLSISVPIFIGAAGVYTAQLTPAREYAIATYPAFVVAIGSLIAISLRTRTIGAPALIKIAANYSFTLYLIHYTILSAIAVIFDPHGWIWLLAATAVSNLAAYFLARLTEMRHRDLAALIRRHVALISKRSDYAQDIVADDSRLHVIVRPTATGIDINGYVDRHDAGIRR
jgi:peptidoglycan/LPS O-acetylase OafA/YrhL